jgi:hypothetical protein
MERIGMDWTGMDWTGYLAKVENNILAGLPRKRKWSGSDWKGLDRKGPDWMLGRVLNVVRLGFPARGRGLDWTGTKWNGMDWTGRLAGVENNISAKLPRKGKRTGPDWNGSEWNGTE